MEFYFFPLIEIFLIRQFKLTKHAPEIVSFLMHAWLFFYRTTAHAIRSQA